MPLAGAAPVPPTAWLRAGAAPVPLAVRLRAEAAPVPPAAQLQAGAAWCPQLLTGGWARPWLGSSPTSRCGDPLPLPPAPALSAPLPTGCLSFVICIYGPGSLALRFTSLLTPSYRIIESLRLEKTSKVIKSNRHPNPTMPAKPYPEVPCLHVF